MPPKRGHLRSTLTWMGSGWRGRANLLLVAVIASLAWCASASATPIASFLNSFASPQLDAPLQVATDGEGNAWVANYGDSQIVKFNAKGEVLAEVGEKGLGEGQLYFPWSVAIDPEGDVWVGDFASRVQEFSPSGEFMTSIAVSTPLGLAFDAQGDLWVASMEDSKLYEYSQAGSLLKEIGSLGSGKAQFDTPLGIDIDAKGRIWVADAHNSRIEVVNQVGQYLRQFPTGIETYDVAIDAEEKVWVPTGTGVTKFNALGTNLGTFGAAGSGEGQFNGPVGVAVEAGGVIWASDTGNDRVQRWQDLGQPTWQLQAASLSLEDVSCFTEGVCMATENGAGVKVWKGTGWENESVPVVPANARLSNVSCVIPRLCMTVGSYEEGGTVHLVAARWDGLAWHKEAVPLPPGAEEPVLRSVSCPTSESCVAVGYFTDSLFGAQVKLVERWNGTKWSPEGVPGFGWNAEKSAFEESAPYGWGMLTRVSCSSSSFCVATQEKGEVDQWNGSEWSPATVPAASGGYSALAFAVSCTSATDCMAVGSDWVSEGNPRALVAHWDGTEWSSQTPPGGSPGWAMLMGVSCRGTDCMAVGGAGSAYANATPLTVRWDGSTWTQEAAPLPSGATSGGLYGGVSCFSGDACTAAGYSSKGGFVDRWQ